MRHQARTTLLVAIFLHRLGLGNVIPTNTFGHFDKCRFQNVVEHCRGNDIDFVFDLFGDLGEILDVLFGDDDCFNATSQGRKQLLLQATQQKTTRPTKLQNFCGTVESKGRELLQKRIIKER